MTSLAENEPIEIRTKRLLLRGFKVEDAVAMSDLAGEFEIADTMISLPHPFTAELAHEWIASAGPATFAVCELTLDKLVGCAELRDIEVEHGQAELSFWVGHPFWGRGLATEAAASLIRYGFDSLGLNRIYAHRMTRNPASGRVLCKLGMQHEGLLRQRVRKWGRFEDVCLYAILKSDVVASADGG